MMEERDIQSSIEIVKSNVMDLDMYFAENDKYPWCIDGDFIDAIYDVLQELKKYMEGEKP